MRGGEPVKTNAGRRKNTVPSGRNAGAAVCPYGSRRNRAGGDATVFIIDKAACGLCTRLINFGGNEGEMRKRDGPPDFRRMAVGRLFVFGRNALKQGHPDRTDLPRKPMLYQRKFSGRQSQMQNQQTGNGVSSAMRKNTF